MKRVFKYLIPFDDQPHDIKECSAIVHVGMQEPGGVTVWAEHFEDWRYGYADNVIRLQVFGTGHEVPPYAEHVGSTQDGPFVWHVYDVARK